MHLKATLLPSIVLLLLCPAGLLWTQSREGSSFDQAQFVPDIALILDLSGVARDMASEQYYSLVTRGFIYPFLLQIGSSGLNAHRGWNFNYGELSLYSVVDPYFDMFTVIDLAPDGAGLEEAYFSTRKLPYEFQVKASKFLASFGRINEQHEHSWDFANRPLIEAAFFGEDGLDEIGAQATWVPPTSFYLMFRAEVLNSANQQSLGTSGISDPGSAISIPPVQGPNLYLGYARTAFDLDEASFLLGVSNANRTTRTDQAFSSGGVGQALDANTDILGGDVKMKYSLDAIRYLSFKSEYMYRAMNGIEYIRDGSNLISVPKLDKHNSGFYAEAVAKVNLLWRFGIRYDLLIQNYISLGGVDQHMPSDLPRHSAMGEYSPKEFSRLRLQFDRDMSRFVETSGGWSRQPYAQVVPQANLTIGAHAF